MKMLKQSGTLLLAAISLGILVYFLMGDQIAERRIPLMVLSALSLYLFSRPNAMASLVVIIPMGPILDLAFLTPGRGIYATETVLLAATTIWLVDIVRQNKPWPRPTLPVLLLCIYASLGIVALLASSNSLAANLRMMRQLFLTGMTALLLQDLFSIQHIQQQLRQRWAAATLLGLSFLALGGIAEFLATRAEPGSFYRSSDTLAVHIAFFSPLALSIWMSTLPRLWRLAGATSWIVSIMCLPLTASRGAMGSVLITSLALLLLATVRGRILKQHTMIILLVMGLGSGVLITHPEIAGENFASKINASLKGDFFSTRSNEWNQAIAGLKTSPLIGVGPEASTNSIPLEVAQRNGIPAALFLFASLFIAIFIPLRHAWDGDFSQTPLIWGLIFGMLGFFTVGLAETGLGARTTPILAAVIAISSSWFVLSREKYTRKH